MTKFATPTKTVVVNLEDPKFQVSWLSVFSCMGASFGAPIFFKFKIMTKDKRLKDIEEDFLKNSLLRLDTIKNLEDMSPLNGLLYIIRKQNTCNTIFVEDNSIMIIGEHRRRSVGDLFLLMRYYYPEITLKEIGELLVELLDTGKISTDYCYTISKRVFWDFNIVNPAVGNSIYAPENSNEFNFITI